MRKRYLPIGGEQYERCFNLLNGVGKLVKKFHVRRIGEQLRQPAARGFDPRCFLWVARVGHDDSQTGLCEQIQLARYIVGPISGRE